MNRGVGSSHFIIRFIRNEGNLTIINVLNVVSPASILTLIQCLLLVRLSRVHQDQNQMLSSYHFPLTRWKYWVDALKDTTESPDILNKFAFHFHLTSHPFAISAKTKLHQIKVKTFNTRVYPKVSGLTSWSLPP